MRIPPEVAIRATIKLGSVFYFPEETFTSNEPHYFIVINVDPLADEAVLLVCSSSQLGKVKRRHRRQPRQTLVTVTPAEYPDFSVDSIVDCNTVWQKDISELVQKRRDGRLTLKARMGQSILEAIRQGVLASPMVERHVKTLLRQSHD